MMRHNDPKLFKDTFWNNERVKRNLKIGDVAKYLNAPYFTVGSWFCGKAMPKEANIRKLCKWFSEMLPDDPISFDDGKRHFEIARLTWQADHDLTLKAHGTDQDDNKGEKFMGGRKNYKTEVGKFIRDHGVKHKDLAEELGVEPYRISYWVSGRYLPDSDYIFRMAQKFDTDADILSDMFLKAYNDYHNVEGQKTITDAIVESHEEPDDILDDQPSLQEVIDKALDDRDRFVKWSELYNKVLFARPDIVAHLMYLYTQWDYYMWNAIEALSQERNDIPFWVLRTIIVSAERVKYFDERPIPGEEDYIDE